MMDTAHTPPYKVKKITIREETIKLAGKDIGVTAVRKIPIAYKRTILSSMRMIIPTHPIICLTAGLNLISRYSIGVDTPARRQRLAKKIAAIIQAGTVLIKTVTATSPCS